MKKKFVLLSGTLALLFILCGCVISEEQEIYYKDQLRPVSQVEEIISDELEVENPDFDLEVNIYEESED